MAKTRTLRSDILFAFTLALACYLAWLVRDALVLLYVSALFAVVLSPLVSAIANVRVHRWQPFRRIAVPVLLVLVVGALIAFGFLALPPDPDGRIRRSINGPVTFSDLPVDRAAPAPLLGEHTDEVLAELRATRQSAADESAQA